VRHIFGVANSWMNVAAGSAGNTGAPGPAGFTNDPQMVIYTPVVRDGTTPLLDYDAKYSQTITDPTLPARTVNYAATSSPGIGGNTVNVAGAGTTAVGVGPGTIVTNTTNPGSIPANCYVTGDAATYGPPYGLSCTTIAGTRGNGVQAGDNIKFDTYFVQVNNPGTPSPVDTLNAYFEAPQSTGNNQYYFGQCMQYSTAGTAPTGLTSGKIYWLSPQDHRRQVIQSDRFQLTATPYVSGDAVVAATTLGSGAQHLDARVCHSKFMNWHTADIDGGSFWIGIDSKTKEPFEMALDQSTFTGERLYWEQSGVVPPFNLNNAAGWSTLPSIRHLTLAVSMPRRPASMALLALMRHIQAPRAASILTLGLFPNGPLAGGSTKPTPISGTLVFLRLTAIHSKEPRS
jgi:hypothetical protein